MSKLFNNLIPDTYILDGTRISLTIMNKDGVPYIHNDIVMLYDLEGIKNYVHCTIFDKIYNTIDIDNIHSIFYTTNNNKFDINIDLIRQVYNDVIKNKEYLFEIMDNHAKKYKFDHYFKNNFIVNIMMDNINDFLYRKLYTYIVTTPDGFDVNDTNHLIQSFGKNRSYFKTIAGHKPNGKSIILVKTLNQIDTIMMKLSTNANIFEIHYDD